MFAKSNKFALIIARANSTRLPGKNKLLLGGMPLFQWSVESALRSGLFDEVWVSSDDADILEISSKMDKINIDKRPSNLSGEEVKSYEVLKYMIEKLKGMNKHFDHFCLLHPTSPFRNEIHINSALELLDSPDVDFVVGVRMFETPPHFALDISSGLQPVHKDYLTSITRTQDVPAHYHPAGGIYAGKTDAFLKSRHFYGKRSRGLILDHLSSWDINTKDDFSFAEVISEYLSKLMSCNHQS